MLPSAWDVASILAKALTYAATLCASGGVFFLTYSHDLLAPEERHRIRRQIGILLAMGVLASCSRIPILVGSMSGEVAGMFDGALTPMLLKAGEGRATGIRIVGLLLATVAIMSDGRLPLDALPTTAVSERRCSLVTMGIGVAGAGIAAMSFAAVGHAEAAAPTAPTVFLLCVHLICVAFWLGALGPLRCVAQARDLRHIAATAGRFGQTAVVMVGLLIVAGIGVLWRLIGTPAALWTSPYGRLVLVKLVLVAALLGLAAMNKLRLTPRLADGDPDAARSLRRSIAAELVVAGLILGITATFTTVTGPPQPRALTP